MIASSPDGQAWRLAQDPAYGPTITLVNGSVIELFARQRPQLLFEKEAGNDVTVKHNKGRVGGGGGEDNDETKRLLAVVNGAELAQGTTSLMQGSSFTLIHPIRT